MHVLESGQSVNSGTPGFLPIAKFWFAAVQGTSPDYYDQPKNFDLVRVVGGEMLTPHCNIPRSSIYGPCV